MALSLRTRITLTLLPLLVLLALLGGAAMALLYHLGGRIDAILRENYESVVYMERLNEALERIDSSFQFAIALQDKAQQQYADNWNAYRKWLHGEEQNITEPGEAELVDRLQALTASYRQKGDAFYAKPADDPRRRQDYFGDGGLLDTFKQIKGVSQDILVLNQTSMVNASRQARRTARDSMVGFSFGLAAVASIAVWLAWRTARAIVRPIQAVTHSARAIGAGNLDQVLPVTSMDELGQLAETFNLMARQLRHYRQTNYSRLVRAQQTSQATIDSFPDPVLVVDPEGRVEMANPAAQRLLGVTRPPAPDASGKREATGDGIALPWQPPEPLREPLHDALRQQRAYLPEEFDRTVMLRVEGAERSFLPRILPIRDPYGGTLGAAVVLEDVTRFRLLDQVKSDLVATASHELKTPLTGVRLALHLLLEETVGPLTSKQAELLMDARDNAERLLAMVNNLLDLARLEQHRGALSLQPESPAALLKAAAAAAGPRAEDKGVLLRVEAPDDLPPVAADHGRLGHAFANLLDNALKYTERGGRVTLSAAAADGRVTLTVADTGLGIPPEYLPHVFEKFLRIPGRAQEEGTGLGLAIVREIVQAHGGTITCESQPGAGTVFRIELPAWDQRPAEALITTAAP
jgi:signal transduction histidine kinase/HAMP domain-containing protein